MRLTLPNSFGKDVPRYLHIKDVRGNMDQEGSGTSYFVETFDGEVFDESKNYFQVYVAADLKMVGVNLWCCIGVVLERRLLLSFGGLTIQRIQA